MEEQKKKVDESYKEKVNKEKGQEENAPAQAAGGPTGEKEAFQVPEASFSFFVTTLAMQATLSLGDVPEPHTNKKEENLPQAKFLIDTLGILQEKTKGNLTKEEDSLLEGILYELRMRYVEKTGGKK